MAFSKYLTHHPPDSVPEPEPQSENENEIQTNPRPVEFQIPSFIYSQPSLVPGGGAEILPYSPWDLTGTGTLTGVTAPSPLPGLPLYSASGFDLLSILSRIATRPNPRVFLGPVDLTCSFVVVDTRRHDHPIVYCSPSFCILTGYPESNVLGRNCRFLQAPPGISVGSGDARLYTDGGRVASMKRMLGSDKECQISIVNYKRDGNAFCNLVTVIPIGGGENGLGGVTDVVYHVGFQVDLGEQPNAILQKLKDGSYVGIQPVPVPVPSIAPKKNPQIPPLTISKTLKSLLSSPSFLSSFPTTPTTQDTHPLSPILLQYSPDFLHVVSLKGAFLYVAPSIRRVLGWDPQDLIGKSIADLAHPADVVPLMRELKQGSSSPSSSSSLQHPSPSSPLSLSPSQPPTTPAPPPPRTVDLLYRALTKSGTYIWLESRGRLHPEPGKGRKAIVLSGRALGPARAPAIEWGEVARRGVCEAVYIPGAGGGGNGEGEEAGTGTGTVRVVYREFWCVANAIGTGGDATLMSIGKGVRDVLGWEPMELVGRRVGSLVCMGEGVGDGIGGEGEVRCGMARKDGGVADVVIVFYPSSCSTSTPSTNQDPTLAYTSTTPTSTSTNLPPTQTPTQTTTPTPLILQIRLRTPHSSYAYSSSLLTNPSVAHSLLAPITLTHSLAHTSSSSHTSPSTSSSSSSPHSHSALSHNPHTLHPTPPHTSLSLFAELDTSRGTSWQYELQRLRFANRRLGREVGRLEGVLFGGAGVVASGKIRGDGEVEGREAQAQVQVKAQGGEEFGAGGDVVREIRRGRVGGGREEALGASAGQVQVQVGLTEVVGPTEELQRGEVQVHPDTRQSINANAVYEQQVQLQHYNDAWTYHPVYTHSQGGFGAGGFVTQAQAGQGYTQTQGQGQYEDYTHACVHTHEQEYSFNYEYNGVDQYVHHPHPHSQHSHLYSQHQHSHSHSQHHSHLPSQRPQHSYPHPLPHPLPQHPHPHHPHPQHHPQHPRQSKRLRSLDPTPTLTNEAQAQFQLRLPLSVDHLAPTRVPVPFPALEMPGQAQGQMWAQHPRGLKRAWAGYD